MHFVTLAKLMHYIDGNHLVTNVATAHKSPFSTTLTANIAMPKSFLAVTGDAIKYYFWATLMHYIDEKGHILDLKSKRNT